VTRSGPLLILATRRCFPSGLSPGSLHENLNEGVTLRLRVRTSSRSPRSLVLGARKPHGCGRFARSLCCIARRANVAYSNPAVRRVALTPWAAACLQGASSGDVVRHFHIAPFHRRSRGYDGPAQSRPAYGLAVRAERGTCGAYTTTVRPSKQVAKASWSRPLIFLGSLWRLALSRAPDRRTVEGARLSQNLAAPGAAAPAGVALVAAPTDRTSVCLSRRH
jgi:hypothetical protein